MVPIAPIPAIPDANANAALPPSIAARLRSTASRVGLWVRPYSNPLCRPIASCMYVAGLALGAVPPFLGVVDTVAGIALAVGGAYFVVRLLVVAKRRLLWRVRRKLILSYIFVGFIPVILIASFFLLSGFLLFYSF